jgi:O-antigen/teichoic acid export membrane protein
LQVPIIGLSTLLTTVLTMLFVPHLGIMGAALALLLAAVMQVFFSALTLRHALTRVKTQEVLDCSR